MIQIFRAGNNSIVETKNPENDSWVNIYDPTALDMLRMEEFAHTYDIPFDFFTDPLDIDERARYDYDENVYFMTIRLPVYDENNPDIPFSTMPLGVIYHKDVIFTISTKRNKIIEDFIRGKEKFLPFGEKRILFVLRIFLKTVLLYLNDLKEINRRTDIIEKDLHTSIKNKELIKLLNLEKSLVFFTTSIKSNEIMMERLLRSRLMNNEDNRDSLEDIIIDNKQALEMSKISSDILSGMMDAFASVISNNLNVIMKFLTSLSIIMMIPTVISSLFGMNVHVPFAQSPWGFYYVLIISFVLAIIVAFLLFKKRFLKI